MNGKHDRGERLAAELRESLIDAGAKPRDLTPLPGQEERGEHLLASIITMPRDGDAAASPVLAREPRRVKTWARAGAFVVAAAAIALALVIVRPGQNPQPAAASTPALLHFQDVKHGSLPAKGRPARSLLRDLAARAESLPVASGPVQHLVLDSWWSATDDPVAGTASSVLVPVRRDSYFQPDGVIRVIERQGAPLDDEGRIAAKASASQPVTSDETFESPDPGPDYADTLPTDPRALRAVLMRNHDPAGCDGAVGSCFVADLIDLHHNYVVPSALTSAFWEVLADEQTVTSLGLTRDRLGRAAVAFTTPGQDRTTQHLVFADPQTGAYLGEEVILTARSEAYGFEPPAVISFSALVESTRTDEDQLPPSR